MTLLVHRCERTDGLVSSLAGLLRQPMPDPFAPDIVAVPTQGVERFLSQRLSMELGATASRTDGICANVQFPSPAALVASVLAAVSGIAAEDDAWRPPHAAWSLLQVIDANADDPLLVPLANHLGLLNRDRRRAGRRLSTAHRLAALFSSYASQRPELQLAWVQGLDEDGRGGPLPPDQLWQAHLWRLLRERIGTASPAERLADTVADLERGSLDVALPERLSVFGPTRLPEDQLQVLNALAAHRDVHVWLADASPARWEALATVIDAGEEVTPAQADQLVVNPLLRSLGRESRELRVRLATTAAATGRPAVEDYRPADLTAPTLLGHIQRSIRDNVVPSRWPVPATDQSLSVHACHGPARQVEVVREVILGLLADDPGLQPRDIVVMCPDLTVMAPLVTASLTGDPGTAVGDLRLRIADRAPEQDNSLVAALAALLDLVTGRMAVADVLDFAALPAVARRFDLDADGIARLHMMAGLVGVRWGLDADHRAEYDLGWLSTGTWAWGLDRLLLGIAMSEDELVDVSGVLPSDAAAGNELALLGSLADLIEALRGLRREMVSPGPPRHWRSIIERAVRTLTLSARDEPWELPNALSIVAELPADTDVAISLAEVRALLAGALAGRPTRSNFASGGLTVCGLLPMRSVPHRVVILLGMDDDVFPRSTVPDGDDVLARHGRPGERDARREDRQVLLDAVMAARDNLVITFTGADVRTNEKCPPAVPVDDLLRLLDAIDPTVRDRVVVTHPLQPFDERNFIIGALVAGATFSHDKDALAAAESARGTRRSPDRRPSAALPRERRAEVGVTELTSFLKDPAMTFLRTRIGVVPEVDEATVSTQIPVEIRGLEKWAIGDRIRGLLMAGRDAGQIAAAERLRGTLPVGALGIGPLQAIGRSAEAVATAARAVTVGESRQAPLHVELPSGRRLTGLVPDIYDRSVVTSTYSKPKAKQLLAVWPSLLALAVEGGVDDAKVVAGGSTRVLTAPPAAQAAELLDILLDLYELGQTAPLPLPAETGQLYAERRTHGSGTDISLKYARQAWDDDFGDGSRPVNMLLYRGEFAELLAQRAVGDLGSTGAEGSYFGELAMLLWAPILTALGRTS